MKNFWPWKIIYSICRGLLIFIMQQEQQGQIAACWMSSEVDRRCRLCHTVPELDMTWCLGPPEACFFPYRFPACRDLDQLKCLWQPWGRTAPWCPQMCRREAARLGTRCWRQMYGVECLHSSQEQPTRHSVSRRNSWKMHHPGKVNRAK